MSSMLIYEPSPQVTRDTLEDELVRAFNMIRSALARGDAVVVSLDERDVQAVGEVPDAALAHGLLGLVRALALEGRKPGWRIAVLSSPRALDPEERLAWIERLAASPGASGSLVRLGGEHLGRVAV
jgi:hypothetical protein